MLYFRNLQGIDEQNSIVAIVGPTAIGKTSVGIELAALLERHAEILSVDSMQVYRQMDIGTAKPSKAEQSTATFKMIDIVDPDQEFSLAEYQELAGREMLRLSAGCAIALLVGGTGLYFRSLTTRLDIPETPPNQAFRDEWYAVAATQGTDAVRQRLIEVDEAASLKIHPNDVRRMVRALEVFDSTGTPLSEWHRRNREAESSSGSAGMYFCLNCDRNELYRTIERRVDQMVREGLVDEVAALRQMGYGPKLKPMQALGYRQVNEYLDGNISLEDAVTSTKAETRQFARRQLVWYRADKRLQWIETDGQTAKQIAKRILASINKQSIN